MNRKRTSILYLVLYAFGISCLLISSCNKKALEEMVICTQIPVEYSVDKLKENSYIQGSRLVAFKLSNPNETFQVLTCEFYSASSPNVFYTGEKMVFSAQKSANDVWQIWEINLLNFEIVQITKENSNCTDPLYLPTGEIVYSRESKFKTEKGHTLIKCQGDGSSPLSITFHPHTDLSSGILQDGRILHVSQQVYPYKGSQKLMVMRPDGTKTEFFYQGDEGAKLLGRAWETTTGKIVFVEENPSSKKGQLVLLSYNNPFHSKQIVGEVSKNIFSVYPISEGEYLVSNQDEKNKSFSLSILFSTKGTMDKEIFSDENYHTIEPVINQVKQRARKLPSAVNLNKKSGLLLFQNVHVSSIEARAETPKDTTVTIEITGMDGILGTVHPRKDGSVYLKVKADTPFQFRVLNDKDEIIRGPSEWLWVRPNERRGCVGCHADREMVPGNHVPIAVKRHPLEIPTSSEKEEVKQ